MQFSNVPVRISLTLDPLLNKTSSNLMQFWKHRGFTSPTDAGMTTLTNDVQLANVEFPIVLIPSCRMSERRFVHPKKPKLPIERTFLCIEMCSSLIQALNEESSINPRFGGSTIVQRCIQF